jgi:hypothetical protein
LFREVTVKMNTKLPGIAACLCAFLLPAAPAGADELIEDFEGPDAASRWTFSNGPEFPGADGQLRVLAAEGEGGSAGGVLSFDFTGGGSYVAALRTLEAPVACQGISFSLKGYVHGSRGVVRLVDETGQTHQTSFPLRPDAGEWVAYVVLTGGDEAHWGGADDGVFHGGLAGLAILVDRGLGHHATGSVAFDNVWAVDARAAQLDLLTQLRSLVTLGTEPMSSFMGVNIHFIEPEEAQLDLAAAAGFRFVRMDLIWGAVESSPGVYDFLGYDRLQAALEARGMEALFILDYGNALYYEGGGAFDDKWGPQTPASRDAYAAFAAAAALHFDGRGAELEIWNEPNIDVFWHPAPDPALYSLLAASALAAIKGASASTKVAVGATAGVDTAFIDAALSHGGLDLIDRVSIHPYRSTLPPETFFDEASVVGDIIESRLGRTDVSVISGEWGYSTTWTGGNTPEGLHRQALWAVREVLFNLSRRVQKVVWYDLTCDGDDPAEREHNFGLLEHGTLAPRPSYDAIKTFHDLTVGLDQVSIILVPHENLHGLAFEDLEAMVLVVWNARAGSDAEIVIPDYGTEYLDMFGAAFPGVTHEGGWDRFTLSEEAGPVYMRMPVCAVFPCDASDGGPEEAVEPVDAWEPPADAEAEGDGPTEAADGPADAPADDAEGGREGGDGGCACTVAA